MENNNRPTMPENPDCGCEMGQQPPSGLVPPENTFPANCVGRLGYAYVPVQGFNDIYPPNEALQRGTIFPELDMPFGVYGAEVG